MKIYLSLITLIVSIFFLSAHAETDSNTLIKERIKPIGKVNIATPLASPTQLHPVASSENIGKLTYESKCVICHGTGIAGAPKFRDEAEWKPRLTQGMSVLLTHVKQGYKAMPPKGTCVSCSDSDLEAAIKYMSKK